jgi:hypothetical protein
LIERFGKEPGLNVNLSIRKLREDAIAGLVCKESM